MGAIRTIVTKAMKDEKFRERLLKNPTAAIQTETGIELPPGMTIHVHENTANAIHVVLPSPLEISADRSLSENELAQVAGGVTTKPTLIFVTSQCKTGPICGGLPQT